MLDGSVVTPETGARRVKVLELELEGAARVRLKKVVKKNEIAEGEKEEGIILVLELS
jgi:hypothetical protein